MTLFLILCSLALILLAAVGVWRRTVSRPPARAASAEELLDRSYRLYCAHHRLYQQGLTLTQAFYGEAGIFRGIQRLLAFQRYTLPGLPAADGRVLAASLVENGLLPPLRAAAKQPPDPLPPERYRANLGFPAGSEAAESGTARERLEEIIREKKRELSLLEKDSASTLSALADDLTRLCDEWGASRRDGAACARLCGEIVSAMERLGFTTEFSGGLEEDAPLPAILQKGQVLCAGTRSDRQSDHTKEGTI